MPVMLTTIFSLTEYLGDAAQVVAITVEGYVLILEVVNKCTGVIVVSVRSPETAHELEVLDSALILHLCVSVQDRCDLHLVLVAN
jgi:hypothetical protein